MKLSEALAEAEKVVTIEGIVEGSERGDRLQLFCTGYCTALARSGNCTIVLARKDGGNYEPLHIHFEDSLKHGKWEWEWRGGRFSTRPINPVPPSKT